MSVSQGYVFDTAANFTVNGAQIDETLDIGKLALIPNTGQNFLQTFDNDTGFTYDNTKAEFVGGKVQQKDTSPLNSVLGARYGYFSANWNKSGSALATLNGSPTVVSNRLQCFGVQGLSYGVTNSGVGAIKIKYKPNYTGSPSTNRNIILLANTATGHSRIALTHSPSGDNFRLGVVNSTGVNIVSTVAIGPSNINLSAANTYEIEINWDNVTGVIRLFLDGNLHGTSSPGAWTHGTGSASLYIGASPVVYNTANASFDDLIYFNAVQHTSAYTPGYTVNAALYLGSSVALPVFPYTGVGTIQAVESSSVVEAGTPRYIVGGFYWNGSAWVASNGTYSQANDSATVILQLPNLNVTGALAITVSIVFTDTNTQSNVDLISVTVTGQKYSTTGRIQPIQGIQVSEILSYSDTVTTPANTSLGRVLIVDGTPKYWDGVAWVTSDYTLLQTNTEEEINSNVSSLNLDVNTTIVPCWVLFSTSNTATSSISLSSINYNFGGVPVDASTCIVYGYLRDISGNPLAGIKLTFQLLFTSSKIYKEASNNIISPQNVNVFTDANGYFSVVLIRSSEYESATTYKTTINFKTVDSQSNVIQNSSIGTLSFSVPDAVTKDITSLLPTP